MTKVLTHCTPTVIPTHGHGGRSNTYLIFFCNSSIPHFLDKCTRMYKGKGNVYPTTGNEGPEGD
jgi:hypothetical protein